MIDVLEDDLSIDGEDDSPASRLEKMEKQEANINQILTIKNLVIVFKKIYMFILGIFLLYLMEYLSITVISSVVADKYKSKYKPDDMPKTINLLFELLQLSYQVGIFTTRSSLDIIQLKRIWIALVMLGSFMLLFFIQSIISTTLGIWLAILNLYLIGFSGGFAYCNIFHQILSHPKVPKKEKEIAMNISDCTSDLGIMANSLVGFILEKVVYN